MQIIILEGTATSGKTTVKNFLVEYLKTKSIKHTVVEENETLMPLLDNTDPKTAIEHLQKVFDKYIASDFSVLIFDRLYFSHVFRTNSSIETFRKFENTLKQHNAKTFLLTINEEAIPERITQALEHRDEQWQEYVQSKGSFDEIVEYYTSQQRKILSLIQDSIISYEIIDTTNMDFEGTASHIAKQIG